MKKLLLLLLCLPFIGLGQEWTFGGTMTGNITLGYSVQQTTDGGYIIAGSTESFGSGSNDVYLIKTDGNGIEQWSKTFGGTGEDYGWSVKQTTDGGYIIAGTTESFGNGQKVLYLIKTDDNGIEEWSQTFGGLAYYAQPSVQQTTDGGYIIGTSTDGTTLAYLVKTDDNGIEEWSQNIIFTADGDYVYSVQQTTDGGYIITGSTEGISNSVRSVYLLKTNNNGVEQWNTTFGGNGSDMGFSVQQTTDGGYIIAGMTFSFGSGSNDVYLIKTDGNGVGQWSKTFGGTDSDNGYSVQQTTDGGYIITGSTRSFGNGDFDIYLVKTDGNGVEQWTKTFGGTDSDGGYSVQQTTDGGYIITGSTESFGNGQTNVYLIKTDGNGNATSTYNIPINPNRKLEKVVDILGKETKPKTNTPLIEIYDDGTVEKRIVIE